MIDKIEIALAAYGLLNMIARATPTKKDDKIMSVVGKWLNLLVLKSNNLK